MIRKPHSDVEEMPAQSGREWGRLMLEEHLSLRAQLDKRTEVKGSEGKHRPSCSWARE